MVKMSYDVVKRWVNEAQEAASSDNIMVQVDSTDYIQILRFMLCVCVYRCVAPAVFLYTHTSSTHKIDASPD